MKKNFDVKRCVLLPLVLLITVFLFVMPTDRLGKDAVKGAIEQDGMILTKSGDSLRTAGVVFDEPVVIFDEGDYRAQIGIVKNFGTDSVKVIKQKLVGEKNEDGSITAVTGVKALSKDGDNGELKNFYFEGNDLFIVKTIKRASVDKSGVVTVGKKDVGVLDGDVVKDKDGKVYATVLKVKETRADGTASIVNLSRNEKAGQLVDGKYALVNFEKKDAKGNITNTEKVCHVENGKTTIATVTSGNVGDKNLFNDIHLRVMAIFLFAAMMWILEVVPAWATSIITMILLIFTVSDGAFGFLVPTGMDPKSLVGYKDFMAAFADPTIMLFMGGFVLAIAATKVGLDVVLAKILLKPFGTNPRTVLLGILLVVAVFSMFMSNTATAAMMLAFLAPVLKNLPADGKGRIGLALAIPIGANLGGIGTPIGTPPNVIALGYLKQNLGIEVGFGDWCIRMVPFVIVMLLIAWFFLLLFFPFKAKSIELKIEADKKKDFHFWVVAATFVLTITLWLIPSKITNLNSNEVALIPFAIFVATGVFSKKDFAEINWDVLWMVAGGLALGTALMKTGLAEVLVNVIPFASMPALVVIIVSGIVGYAIANFLSHTSAANLLLPILATVAGAVNLSAFGGSAALLIGLAISTSVAMILPISTPPNAIASSTGLVETKDMAKMGIIMGILGLILGYGVLIFVGF